MVAPRWGREYKHLLSNKLMKSNFQQEKMTKETFPVLALRQSEGLIPNIISNQSVNNNRL